MATTAADDHDHDHDHDDGHQEYTTAMIYGYGTAAVAIISCLSALGIILFPTLKSRSHQYFVQFFIALGVGTMTADALVHIIPEALGLHSHAHEEEDHSDHDHEEAATEEIDHTVVVWKMSVVYGGLFLFFAFENGLKVWKRGRKVEHQMYPQDNSIAEPRPTKDVTTFTNEAADIDVIDVEGRTQKSIAEKIEVSVHNVQPETDSPDKIYVCWKFTTVLLTVFIGDILHNFADGLAIGVSFTASATAGIGTSIAVLCHEIPHEFGDFAIYLKNGASKWQAIGLNAVAACCAFIGLYVGIAASQNEAARQWLLALVAGMFLYIALVQVMVELLRPIAESPILIFTIQIIGMLLGWTLMLLLGLYEEDIEASLA